MEKVDELGGELHLLSNNAGGLGVGVGDKAAFDKIDPAFIIKYNTTYISSLQLAYHYMTPLLAAGAKARGKPSVVVNVSSAASVMPRCSAHVMGQYTVCKAAMDSMTRTAHSMYAAQNIKSYGVNPVVYESDMALAAGQDVGTDMEGIAAIFNPFGNVGKASHLGSIVETWCTGTSAMDSGKHYMIVPLANETDKSILFSLETARHAADSDDPLALQKAWLRAEGQAYDQTGKPIREVDLQNFRTAIQAGIELAEEEKKSEE